MSRFNPSSYLLAQDLIERAINVKYPPAPLAAAKVDGSTDDAAAVQGIVNTFSKNGGVVIFPIGTCVLNSASITMKPGITFMGLGASASIIKSTLADYVFKIQNPNGTAEIEAPKFYGIGFDVSYGIQMNSPAGGFTDNNTSQDYMMRAYIEKCKFSGGGGTGTAIQLSKCFDSRIRDNDIESFDVGTDLYGCDICTIAENRYQNSGTYNIRITSESTFGSQTLIQHNDLLGLTNPAAVAMISSSDRDLIVRDNYFEMGTGTLSSVVQITGGYRVTIEDNRVEVPSTVAPNWLDIQTSLQMLSVKKNTTTGNAMGPTKFPSTVKYYYNTIYRRMILHEGNSQRSGYPFQSRETMGEFGGQTALVYGVDAPGLNSGSYGSNVAVSDKSFLLPAAANYGTLIEFDTSDVDVINGSVNIDIWAKATISGQSLSYQILQGGTVVVTSSVSLTTDYARYQIAAAKTYTDLQIKVWNGDTTNNGDVYVRKIVIERT